MNMNTVPNITEPLQIEKQYAMQAAKEADFGETWLTTANRALALQNIAYQNNPPQCGQQETYITAAQARECGNYAQKRHAHFILILNTEPSKYNLSESQ
jgi:hypothetical protein